MLQTASLSELILIQLSILISCHNILNTYIRIEQITNGHIMIQCINEISNILTNPEQEIVWLTQKQMEVLFNVKRATVSEHISNILALEELEETSAGFSNKSIGGRKTKNYNFNVDNGTVLQWRLDKHIGTCIK